MDVHRAEQQDPRQRSELLEPAPTRHAGALVGRDGSDADLFVFDGSWRRHENESAWSRVNDGTLPVSTVCSDRTEESLPDATSGEVAAVA